MSYNMARFAEAEPNESKVGFHLNKTKKEHLLIAIVVTSILLLGLLIAVILLAVKVSKTPSPTTSDLCTTHGCLAAAMELLESINTSVDPCEDFYQFACGKWAATNSEGSNSKMEKLGVDNQYKLSDNIFRSLEDPSIPHNVKKIADAYRICGQNGALTEADKAWLLRTLKEVGGWPMVDKDWDENIYYWEYNLAEAIHKLFLRYPITVSIDVNIFDSRKRIITISQQMLEDSQSLDKEQILSVVRIISDRGNETSLEKEYKEMETFTELMRKMIHSEAYLLDDPNESKILTIKQLNKIIPWINWLEFLRTIYGSYITLNEDEPVLLIGTTYISKVLESMFNGTISKRIIANYIAASYIQDVVTFNEEIATESRLLSTKKSLRSLSKFGTPKGFSGSCLNFYSLKASYAVDFINYKYRTEKTMDNKMMEYFFSAMKYMISDASWVDKETKSAALEKLKEMKQFSGFPEMAKDSKKVEEYFLGLSNITENNLENQMVVQRHLLKRQAELLRKNVDRNTWPEKEGAHGSQLNAMYGGEFNAMIIPAEIQLEPQFSPEKPKYWNFGSLGFTVGHEITHAFDTKGSRNDKLGNMKNWWKPKTKEEFNKRVKCMIEKYNKIPFGFNDYYVNGTLTAAENVADNGGLRQAFFAYKLWEKDNGKEKLLPGFEKYNAYQLFFIAVAQPFCFSKVPPEYIYVLAIDDEHSPMQFRVKAAVSNFEEFAKAFNCKPGTPMNPVKKCVVW